MAILWGVGFSEKIAHVADCFSDAPWIGTKTVHQTIGFAEEVEASIAPHGMQHLRKAVSVAPQEILGVEGSDQGTAAIKGLVHIGLHARRAGLQAGREPCAVKHRRRDQPAM